MPKLWAETIQTHHREVREAILGTTVALVAEHGLAAATMSQIAERAGIGRATLYKHFRDVESILVAWHDRHVERHLAHLAAVRDEHTDPLARLQAVLEAYALVSYERLRGHPHKRGAVREPGWAHHGPGEHLHGQHAPGIAALVHRSEHVAAAQRRLTGFLRELVSDAARSGVVRRDIPADELALYCLHAVEAASALRTTAAVHRLVEATLSGLSSPA